VGLKGEHYIRNIRVDQIVTSDRSVLDGCGQCVSGRERSPNVCSDEMELTRRRLIVLQNVIY